MEFITCEPNLVTEQSIKGGPYISLSLFFSTTKWKHVFWKAGA